jgi:hypothetical protein
MHQILSVLKSTGIAYNKTNWMHCTNCMQILGHIYVGYISLNLKMISNLSLMFQINCIFIRVKWTKSIYSLQYAYTVLRKDAFSDNSKRKYTLYK